jgi:hypothetical protein
LGDLPLFDAALPGPGSRGAGDISRICQLLKKPFEEMDITPFLLHQDPPLKQNVFPTAEVVIIGMPGSYRAPLRCPAWSFDGSRYAQSVARIRVQSLEASRGILAGTRGLILQTNV